MVTLYLNVMYSSYLIEMSFFLSLFLFYYFIIFFIISEIPCTFILYVLRIITIMNSVVSLLPYT